LYRKSRAAISPSFIWSVAEILLRDRHLWGLAWLSGRDGGGGSALQVVLAHWETPLKAIPNADISVRNSGAQKSQR
jgi:hypothetical protein